MYIYDQNDVCHLSGCFKVICFKYIKPGLEVPKRKKKRFVLYHYRVTIYNM